MATSSALLGTFPACLFGLIFNIKLKIFRKAENQRINALNDYADYAIQAIIHEIQEINATAIQIPSYTLNGSNGLVIHNLLSHLSLFIKIMFIHKAFTKLLHIYINIFICNLKLLYETQECRS